MYEIEIVSSESSNGRVLTGNLNKVVRGRRLVSLSPHPRVRHILVAVFEAPPCTITEADE